jgi:hypothetical protein
VFVLSIWFCIGQERTREYKRNGLLEGEVQIAGKNTRTILTLLLLKDGSFYLYCLLFVDEG